MKAVLTMILCAAAAFATAQCYPDRHNTSPNEGWVSCDMRENPNPEYGNGHWIMYDLGFRYTLGTIQVWNYNATEWLDMGVREVNVDISDDGRAWSNRGTHVLNRADGKSIYEGEILTNLEGDTAKYVLLSVRNTYGGSCAALSEVKIEVLEDVTELFAQGTNDCFEVSVYPNPHIGQFAFNLTTTCPGEAHYTLFDATGRQVQSGRTRDDASQVRQIISTEGLAGGLYHFVVHQGGQSERYAVMKMDN
jgi:hypothetical protein